MFDRADGRDTDIMLDHQIGQPFIKIKKVVEESVLVALTPRFKGFGHDSSAYAMACSTRLSARLSWVAWALARLVLS